MVVCVLPPCSLIHSQIIDTNYFSLSLYRSFHITNQDPIQVHDSHHARESTDNTSETNREWKHWRAKCVPGYVRFCRSSGIFSLMLSTSVLNTSRNDTYMCLCMYGNYIYFCSCYIEYSISLCFLFVFLSYRWSPSAVPSFVSWNISLVSFGLVWVPRRAPIVTAKSPRYLLQTKPHLPKHKSNYRYGIVAHESMNECWSFSFCAVWLRFEMDRFMD